MTKPPWYPTPFMTPSTSPPSSSLGQDFWLFRFGQVISVIGDSCGNIALAWWVLDVTGSAAAMSSVLAPTMFIRIFLLPLCGPLGDRFPRKSLALLSDLWRGSLMLMVGVLIASGSPRIPLIACLYVLMAVGTALFNAISSSIVPQLVRKEQVGTAMRQTHAIASIGLVAGGALGGILVTWIGVEGAFLLNAACFFIAALATWGIRADTTPGNREGGRTPIALDEVGPGKVKRALPSLSPVLRSWWGELQEGFALLYRIPVLFWLSMVAMGLNFVLNPLSVALPVLAKEGRGLPPWFLGALEASIGAGSVLGALLLGRLARRITADRLMVLSIALMGVAVALLPRAPGWLGPLLAMFCLGLGNSWANIPFGSQLSMATPDRYRSRINSIFAFLCGGIGPLGVAFAGIAISRFGLQGMLGFTGLATVLLSPALFRIPGFTAFMTAKPEEASRFFDTHYPAAFKGNS